MKGSGYIIVYSNTPGWPPSSFLCIQRNKNIKEQGNVYYETERMRDRRTRVKYETERTRVQLWDKKDKSALYETEHTLSSTHCI